MSQAEHTNSVWLAERSERWQKVADSLPALDDEGFVDLAEARAAIRVYPELARDVALARLHAPGSRITAYLESLYAGLHRAIYRPPKADKGTWRSFWMTEVPEVAYRLRLHIFWITALFFAAAYAAWMLVGAYPELVALFASEAMIQTVQRGELWTDGLLNIMPSSVLALQIFTNNILVSLTAMCLGVLYGIGTLYIITLNGLMLGGVFAFVAQYKLDQGLLEFISAHGPVELSVIFIASAVGFSIGEALARPGELTRTESFRQAVSDGMKLMLLCIVFLVGAGLIEGYVSPNAAYPWSFKLVIGWSYWLLLLFALSGWRLPGFLRSRITSSAPGASQR